MANKKNNKSKTKQKSNYNKNENENKMKNTQNAKEKKDNIKKKQDPPLSSKEKKNDKLTINKNTSNKDTKKTKKIHLKKKYKNLIWWIFFILFLSFFAFSMYKVLIWNMDNNKIKKIEESILKDVNVEEIEPSLEDENTNLINEPDNKEDIYWKYQDVSFINVDIEELQKENKDTIGWIQVLGTNINYPIVQTNDNNYYLNHDYLKDKNIGGWIFLDYRNDLNHLSNNNIIYGHERYNKSMFGSLKTVLTDSWLNNTDNHIIKISTSEYNYLFQVFSVYTIPEETYYLQTDFKNNNEYQTFLDTITGRSTYNFNTNINTNDKILTLSTCSGNNKRLVVHAKLIKINTK